jgi:hypothetical protein
MTKFVFCFLAVTLMAASFAQADTQMNFRTAQVAQDRGQTTLVAVTSDFRFYAIVCNMGYARITNSKAYLLSPTRLGDLTTRDFDQSKISMSAYSAPKSNALPLTLAAVTQICNHPNGEYTLITKSINGSTSVDFVDGHSTVAEAPKASRGF